MITLEKHGDVTRVIMTSAASRAAGYGVSAYLTRGVLIDCGFPGVGRDFAAFLDQWRPDGIILTHHHEDHAGNVELIARGGLPILAGADTLSLLRDAGWIDLYRRVIWGSPARLVSPVTTFHSAESGLRLVRAPGHSPDHHIVWDAEREILFSADLFLGVKVRVAFPSENSRLLAESVRAAAALRPGRMFDAHRGLVPNPVAALTAKANWMDETIGEIDRRIADGWSDRAIARAVLGRERITHYVSRGKLSGITFVRAVRATPPQAARVAPVSGGVRA
ncbi:MAG: MBL fold metallo-hydrolase [Gemmatimonadaceae bacterium]